MILFVLLSKTEQLDNMDVTKMIGKVFTDQNFSQDVLKSDKPVVIDFWAEWCPPCKMIAPFLEELSQEYQGKVLIGSMNADGNQQAVNTYTVMSLPTVLIFKNGQPMQSLVGAKSKQSYKEEIEKALTS